MRIIELSPRRKEDKMELIKKSAKINIEDGGVKKAKKRIKKVAPQQTTVGNPQYSLEKRMQARALYLSKNGKVTDLEIAKAVGASRQHVNKWKKDENWERELPEYQRQFKEDMIRSIRTGGRGRHKAVTKKATDDALVQVVKDLVGPSVSAVVADFIARKHKEDLLDLERLNRAVRKKLKEYEDGRTALRPVDIGALVSSKINIIKGTRLILGQATEITRSEGEEDSAVTLIMSPEQARSLERLQALEVEYTVLENKEKDTEDGRDNESRETIDE